MPLSRLFIARWSTLLLGRLHHYRRGVSAAVHVAKTLVWVVVGLIWAPVVGVWVWATILNVRQVWGVVWARWHVVIVIDLRVLPRSRDFVMLTSHWELNMLLRVSLIKLLRCILVIIRLNRGSRLSNILSTLPACATTGLSKWSNETFCSL